IMNNLGFCDPVGSDRPLNSQAQSASCSRLDYLTNDYFIATPNPAVNPANGDGYQFWILIVMAPTRGACSNPAFYNGWSDTDPNDACYLRFGWLQTNPVPLNVLLNLAVRTKINGVYGNFGAVCQVKVLSAPPTCPPTAWWTNRCIPTAVVLRACSARPNRSMPSPLVAPPIIVSAS
ncbi:MAG: hypothetical protein IPK99_16590, partial [Flavobacteriales bacterium]|nr:hypothetical protein [Flavobacteriales bacterium]